MATDSDTSEEELIGSELMIRAAIENRNRNR